MWTAKNRGRYDRSKLRYPSDLTDDEWAFVKPLIPPATVATLRRSDASSALARLLSDLSETRAFAGNVPIDVEVGEQALPALSR